MDRSLTLGRLRRFNTISFSEGRNVADSLKRPLSGYLGGIHTGGYWVERLSEEWRSLFGVTHAIPCNSGTSGLLAACIAADIKFGDLVWTTPYSMSATAACAKILGAKIRFIDIEPIHFSINTNNFQYDKPKALIVANLFGHPAYLSALRSWCDHYNVIMIEDNAQSILAREDNRYAGTIGHLGVFSLNVHKHINCGEGGIVVTQNSALADRVYCAVNHGELSDLGVCGLNLRLAEPLAAIASGQLSKVEKVVDGRRALAHEISDMMRGTYIIPPAEASHCKHVYYIWAGLIRNGKRKAFVHFMNQAGIPFNEGYSPLLTRVFKSNDPCPVAELIEDQQIVTFDICSYDPKWRQLKIMREHIKQVASV